MKNYDVKKERSGLYTAKRGAFEIVDVPEMKFFVSDGQGDPNTSGDYEAAVRALYSTSYAVRAVAKAQLGLVHTVGPLEGLWAAEDLRVFKTHDKGRWKWTLMIVQPDWITSDVVEAASEHVSAEEPGAADRVRFESLAEGSSVQVLHVGPYDAEAPTIARMHDEFIPNEHLSLRGRHHEIYLSDPRRVAPSRLRTILRQPVSSTRS